MAVVFANAVKSTGASVAVSVPRVPSMALKVVGALAKVTFTASASRFVLIPVVEMKFTWPKGRFRSNDMEASTAFVSLRKNASIWSLLFLNAFSA